ncbi:MAG: Unknown protein [uncultured Sulfurovum sp.]|uniref:Uncharacterized protein n=1 Tax=uncultured Sulfurovum sp. TaxID=269237 RepID=A0A6S6SDB5_9BACT|nr:MAG: Unknown protein [uncultured Sulfurovum sp.]
MNLSALNNAGSDDQTLSSFALSGNTLSISIEDGNSISVDLEDLNDSVAIAAVQAALLAHELADKDIDETNELITNTDFNGTHLSITDAGGTQSVDLSTLIDNSDDQQITDFSLTGNVLSLTLEDGGTQTVDLSDLNDTASIAAVQAALAAHITLDTDTDETNELQDLNLSGTTLSIANGNSVDLSDLNNSGTDDQAISSAVTTANETVTVTLEDGGDTLINIQDADANSTNEIQDISTDNTAGNLSLSDGATLTLNVNDADSDTTNELITNTDFNGTHLSITDAGGTQSVDLSTLIDNSDDQQITDFSLTGNVLSLTLEDGGTQTVDLSDLNDTASIAAVQAALAAHITLDTDTDETNELQDLAYDASTQILSITNNGSATDVNLSALNNAGSDDQTLSSFALSGNTLSISIEDGNSISVDLEDLNDSVAIAAVQAALLAHELADKDIDETNELITNTDFNGTHLSITDAGGTQSVDLSTLIDNSDDQQITDFSLTGNVLSLTLEDGGTQTVDLSDLNDTASIAAVQAALAAHITLDTDTDETNELQDLNLSGTTLSIANGNSVDLSDLNNSGTDDQAISSAVTVANETVTVTLEDGGDTVINIQDADSNSTNEIQDISTDTTAGNISLSDGSTLTLNVDDADADTTNELITDANLSGTDLTITDAGQTWTVDLSSLDNNGSDNQAISSAVTTANETVTVTLEDGGDTVINIQDADSNSTNEIQDISTDTTAGNISLSDGSTLTLNVDDADADTTNELITDANLSGTDLTITDAGQTWTVDLSSLDNNGSDNQAISSAVTTANETVTVTLEDGGDTVINIQDADSNSTNEIQDISTDTTAGNISLSDGSTLTLNVDDADADTTNELITDANLSGTDLTITDAGQTWTVDLSSLDNNGSDNQAISSAVTTANETVTVTLEDGGDTVINIQDADSNSTNEIQKITSNDGSVSLVQTGNDYDLSVASEITTTLTASPTDALEYDYTSEDTTVTTFRSSPIVAFGKVSGAGGLIRGYGASVVKNSTGNYTVTLDTARDTDDYTIQLSILDSNGVGNDDYDVAYSNQGTGSFVVEVGDNDNGGSDRAARDFEFMFSVMDY